MDVARRFRGALPRESRSVALHDQRLRATQVRGNADSVWCGPFADALELGGSIGVFSSLLAPRCDRLTTIDAAPTAVASARRRLAGASHVDVIPARFPMRSRFATSTSWSPLRSSTT